MDTYSELEIQTLHKAPHWKKALGVGIVVMGLAIGTGELILWPHLITKHGLSLLWLAFLGILFKFGNHLIWSWVTLSLVLVLTFSGKVAYTMLEKSLKVTVPLFFVMLVGISFLNLSFVDLKN